MKELLILSGKGGTGKTTLTGAFALLAGRKVLADCDVDAPDLHLILEPEIVERHDFVSGVKARVNRDGCSLCGDCERLCQYEAVKLLDDSAWVDDFACEGCGVCAYFCPAEAIELQPNHCGFWYVSETGLGPMVHAELMPGEENSGRLVALVKQKAKELAQARDLELILVDGPPGIGCPVISSVSGADYILVVTEPSKSGLHDMERVTSLASHFKVPCGIVINKWDLNEGLAQEMEGVCRAKGLSFLGRIPFDEAVVEIVAKRRDMTEFSRCNSAESIANIWQQVERKLQEEKK